MLTTNNELFDYLLQYVKEHGVNSVLNVLSSIVWHRKHQAVMAGREVGDTLQVVVDTLDDTAHTLRGYGIF